MNNELNVLVVRDGRPGHEKQSLGLVAALKRRYAVQLREICVAPGYKALLRAGAIFLGTCSEGIKSFRPDLIVGTGSHTHLTMLALQKNWGGRTVVCMAPLGILRGFFDLCCIPRHDQVAEGGNILLTDGPPNLNSNLQQHDPRIALVLVGGIDEKSHVWNNSLIARRIAEVMGRFPDFSWTLTTSPRTPADFLATFAACQPEVPVQICPYGATAPGWLEKQLEKAQWVLVTEDSLSMIFEALSAGCRVVTVPVAFIADNKFVRCLADLKKRQLVVSEIDPLAAGQEAGFNEAERCVDFMERQPWWPIR